jgi:Chaperone of endosialidase
MKKYLLLLCLFIFSQNLSAQAPLLFNYQGVARNASGVPLSNQSITVRLTIRDGSAAGASLYSETRSVLTNQFGIFTVVVNNAGATTVTGNFSNINWGAATRFLQVEIDPAGGSNFSNLGATQLLSVPYALYAGNSVYTAGTGIQLTGNSIAAQTTSALWNANQIQGRAVINTAPTNGQVLTWNGTNWAPASLPAGSGITGTGTANFIPKFTGATTVGNSALEDKADSLVLLNKAAFAKSNGSLFFRDSAGMIQFANPESSTAPMIRMFSSGTQNKDRMVIAHSAGFPTWGLEYKDSTDVFYLRSSSDRHFAFNLSNGRMGIGVESPSFSLDINGAQRFVHTGTNTYPNNGIWFANQANTFNRAFIGMAKPDSTIGIYSQHLGRFGIEFEVMREFRIGINNRMTAVGPNPPRSEVHLVHTNFGGSNDGVRIQNEGVNDHYWNLYTSNSTGDFEFYKQGIKRATINQTNGAYTAVSDERLKRNIRVMENGIISKVMQLRPTTYQFAKMVGDEGGIVGNDNRFYNGFLAQEVIKIFPELVFKGSDNPDQDYYTMDYSGFGVIAIKAIQEQQKIIDKQKAEIDLLKKEIELIKQKLGL